MVVGEHAVKAAQKAYRECEGDSTESHRAALTAALPLLPVQVAVKADAIKLIERMAFGYEVMFEKLCHISGTSGADQSWYRAKAREATERLSPLHSITTESNKSIPGDCKRQYQDFMARILSALEPSAAQERCRDCDGYNCDDGCAYPEPSAARELALEEAARWHESEAEGYEAEIGGTDVTGLLLAKEHRISAIAIRSLSSPDHADAGKVEGDGWLPIESAPKDGTVIDLWSDEYGRLTDCYWGAPMAYEGGETGWVHAHSNEWAESPDEFIHWRPLPLPPVKGGQNG